MKLELVETIEQEPPFAGEPAYFDLQYPDLYLPDGACFIWLQFEPDTAWNPVTDVCPVNLSSLREGHWLSAEMSEWRFDLIFLETPSFGAGWYLDLMLREGLYLGQPFLVAFDPPKAYRCNSYFDPEEWDVSYSWEVVHRAEVTAEMVEETVEFLEGALNG